MGGMPKVRETPQSASMHTGRGSGGDLHRWGMGGTAFVSGAYRGHARGLVRDSCKMKRPGARSQACERRAYQDATNAPLARTSALVRPDLAVASMGRSNPFGHPSSQTIALPGRRGIPLLRTDRDGSVTIESDGEGWR